MLNSKNIKKINIVIHVFMYVYLTHMLILKDVYIAMYGYMKLMDKWTTLLGALGDIVQL